MSVSVTFANCSDAKNKVDKSFTAVTTRDCSIVYPCDVHHPTIKVLGGMIDANTVTGLFGRNYWIVSQTLNNGSNLVALTVDALSSWKSSIYGTSQFVNRCATGYNKNLNDNLIIPNKPSTHVLRCAGGAFGNSLGTDRCYIITLK